MARMDGGPWLGNLHFPRKQMRQRQGPAQPREEPEWGAKGILWPSCQTDPPQRTQTRAKDPHEQAPVKAREAHW